MAHIYCINSLICAKPAHSSITVNSTILRILLLTWAHQWSHHQASSICMSFPNSCFVKQYVRFKCRLLFIAGRLGMWATTCTIYAFCYPRNVLLFLDVCLFSTVSAGCNDTSVNRIKYIWSYCSYTVSVLLGSWKYTFSRASSPVQ